ncbi:hypothetical protein [Nostoc sp. UHCC 0870]|uniref:hypothetical protein n=1 Tax=Nostoc sp. UHCC 0870 TaxID=2914041 RepID=UPI001EDD20CD|nr:hypothetical protein [Nostoc sp. UHCC 0870]UKP01405.1 hypothetical protein L6494_29660 [Nostoc sp. UHCC 0870]
MEEPRIIYETLKGERVNDVHWWRVKQVMITCELPLNKSGFELFIALKKTSPRYFSQYHKVKRQITKQLEPSIGEGITGEQFVKLLEQLNIHPNQSTISRWFKSCGGYKSKAFYNKTVLIPICAIALIYKSKTQNNSLAKVS